MMVMMMVISHLTEMISEALNNIKAPKARFSTDSNQLHCKELTF